MNDFKPIADKKLLHPGRAPRQKLSREEAIRRVKAGMRKAIPLLVDTPENKALLALSARIQGRTVEEEIAIGCNDIFDSAYSDMQERKEIEPAILETIKHGFTEDQIKEQFEQGFILLKEGTK